MNAERLRVIEDRTSQLLGRDVRIVSQLGGGQHALTVVADVGDGPEVVIRSFPAGDNAVERELQVLGYVAKLGDWVPHLIAHSVDPTMPIIVTTRVRGGHPAPSLAGAVIANQMAVALARIHELDGKGLRTQPYEPPAGTGVVEQAAQRAWSQLDMTDFVLTHSDFWCGNALWDGCVLTGIVDWLGAHRAPRGVDVAWCRLDLVLLGETEAADLFLSEYALASGVRVADQRSWDLQAAAHADDNVDTWSPNYRDIGRTELTPQLLRRRFDSWSVALLA